MSAHEFEFNHERSLEAAAHLLRGAGGTLDRTKLISLLYIAERELLVESGVSLTGDFYEATPLGPVLGSIEGRLEADPQWHRYIRTVGDDYCLLANPGDDSLSRRMMEKLDDVSARFALHTGRELAEHTRGFGEWIKHWAGPIPLRDVVFAMGEGDELLQEIREKEAERRHMAKLFEGLGEPS